MQTRKMTDEERANYDFELKTLYNLLDDRHQKLFISISGMIKNSTKMTDYEMKYVLLTEMLDQKQKEKFNAVMIAARDEKNKQIVNKIIN